MVKTRKQQRRRRRGGGGVWRKHVENIQPYHTANFALNELVNKINDEKQLPSVSKMNKMLYNFKKVDKPIENKEVGESLIARVNKAIEKRTEEIKANEEELNAEVTARYAARKSRTSKKPKRYE